jgi:hypothetical protein
MTFVTSNERNANAIPKRVRCRTSVLDDNNCDHYPVFPQLGSRLAADPPASDQRSISYRRDVAEDPLAQIGP